MSLSSLQRSRSRHISRACFETLEDRRLMSFTPAVSYPAGTNPQEIVTADFNNDGRLDLATCNTGSGSVSVLLGNGNGTFQAPQTSAAGDNPVSIAVGDFNGDGKLDLTAANGGTGAVSVMRGNGDGTFQAPSGIGVGGDPTSVAVGDFNDDGKLDVAATSNVYVPYYSYYYGYYGFNEGHVHVLLGNGAARSRRRPTLRSASAITRRRLRPTWTATATTTWWPLISITDRSAWRWAPAPVPRSAP